MELILVNGRFVTKAVTGVQRYSSELVSRFGDRIRLLAPARSLQGIQGHLWEQVVLPARVGSGFLWSPGNTGPLALSRQAVTIHDAATLDHPEWFSGKFAALYRFLLPKLMRRARRVITVSEFSKQRLIEHGGISPDRVCAIPNGVDARFRPAAPEAVAALRRKLGLAEDYALAVGSLEPRKNLRGLFQAWQIAQPRLGGMELAVAGGSGKIFSNIGFERLPAGIRLLGYVEDADLVALYGGARMFVYPSLYEGFGLPPLEAMSCGTPVLTSNVTSLPEAVGDAALAVNPTDPEAIADGMIRLAEDGALCGELRSKGRQRAGQFTWECSAEATWQALQEAAADS
ncbi:MAG: glycosyltransferase family 4 protein [Verrucomicrobia bacterium]|nr:glycosyltransferase family 4 protein [Verrucomicrobiota bacterium]